ncbi:hypothetical protein PCC7418_3064 [Halothece sp. PCC 7418]|uniref:Card1-like endonuclease domain-containing protein n=1 Tax=Halothece sp. (strain PCC 7418) TaxID=65093 RepID=UPI0002A06021|nr:DUF1887 family CARF protein [Halothece sp. PCC 7418]AFZ45186.1 hypothetical protein PCC7418_3064 [Halothece sp. PCC 7418]
MNSKVANFLILPTLTLSCGILVTILFPNRGKIAVLIGSTTGSLIGTYSLTRQQVNQRLTSEPTTVDSPQERLQFLQQQVYLFQQHLQELAQDLRENQTAVSALSPSETEPEARETMADDQVVINWLINQGITVQNYHIPDENEEIFNKLATYLGDKYSDLSYFYIQLKRSFSKGQNLSVNLASRSKTEITYTTQFCNRMSDYAFLSSYQYDRKNKMLYASPQKKGLVINFITGGWFERFVYLSLCQLLQENDQVYQSILNPQIVLQNGEDFELDILFLVKNKPFWIECKTGDYQNHVMKYSRMRSVLSIPKECSLLVILGIREQLTQELTTLHDIYVANENNFLAIAENLIFGNDEIHHN